MLDSQTVKAPAASGGGYDAAKRIKGRKRHIVVDPDGRLLMVNLTMADVQDAAGAERIITAVRQRWPLQGCLAALIPAGPDRRLCRQWLKHLFADGGVRPRQAHGQGRLPRLRPRGRSQVGDLHFLLWAEVVSEPRGWLS